jgi:ATP-binding cassette subfamily D (ALD) protein 2
MRLDKRHVAGAVGVVGGVLWLRSRYVASVKAAAAARRAKILAAGGTLPAKKHRVAVDKEFLRRLRVLIPIVLPKLWSKPFLLLSLHSMFLVARTFMSIYVANLDGVLTRSIVEKNGVDFGWAMAKWLGIAIPATYINSLLRYLESKLSLAFRTRLVKVMYQRYMTSECYYRVDNLDSRLDNVDQSLTEDVSQFCAQLAHIWGQISKPLLDIVLMTRSLYNLFIAQSGGQSMRDPALLALLVTASTAGMLRAVTPPFGKMIAAQQKKYGELRAVHARLITHSEEIAFYRGHKVEKSVLDDAYEALRDHMSSLYARRINYTMFEQFLMKYVWGACGLVIIAFPHFAPANAGAATAGGPMTTGKVGGRTQEVIVARGMLINVSDALERLLSSWKDITELAGYTERVYQMTVIFEDMKNEKYEKFQTGALPITALGTVYDNADFIDMKDVPIATPNGDVLIEKVNLRIERNMHVLITGPNGCGKSSLFRMLGSLWPVRGGVLRKPSISNMFYIPQRPYLSHGCLREQFIYPDTTEDMRAKGLTDDDLLKILQVVDLAHVVTREGGWDARNDWRDVLSGGEKQRVGMARVFFHKPMFAILDECTSAVSIDVEGQMYEHAKAMGITLLTVTHRPSLWKYHTHLFKMDGQGGYVFSAFDEVSDKQSLTLTEKKKNLEAQIAELPKLQADLDVLNAQIKNTEDAMVKRFSDQSLKASGKKGRFVK